MVELRESRNDTPLCPHCAEPLLQMLFQELKGLLGRRYVYFCGHCKKVLGVSHRKGFWMG